MSEVAPIPTEICALQRKSSSARGGLMHRSKTGPYSITSSARSSIDGGMARPSALAVLRFTTISNFVGNCTGRSPRAAQNAIHVGGGATKEVYPVGSIGEQAAVSGELRNPINRRYVVSGRPNMIGARWARAA